MEPADLLARMSKMFRADIGPAIADEYPRTQAYLSSVVLQKLSLQLRNAEAHAAAETSERAALVSDLEHLLAVAPVPASVSDAVAALAASGDAGLCALIEVLYAAREELGQARFETLLGRVRADLRRSIDRRMEVAA